MWRRVGTLKKANDLKNSLHKNSKKLKNWLNVTDFTLFKLVKTVKKYPSRGDNNFIKVYEEKLIKYLFNCNTNLLKTHPNTIVHEKKN